MYRTVFQVFTLAFILLAVTARADADMYKYTDENGAVCMTNTLESVPKRYRSAMTVIKEDAPVQKKLLPEVQRRNSDPRPVAAPQAAAQEPGPSGADARSRYIRSGLILVGIFAGCFLLSKLAETLGIPRIGSILCLALVLGGGAYLYRLHVDEVKELVVSLRKETPGPKKEVDHREDKTEQILQKMPEASEDKAEQMLKKLPEAD